MNPTNVPKRPAATLALGLAIGAALSLVGYAANAADAWKYVPAGTCEKTASPTSPTGFGQLAAFKPASKG